MDNSATPPAATKQHVLVVGGTGRTGRRLVERLASDDRFEVSVLVRDRERAQLIFGPDLDIEILEGDLRDVASWEDRLGGVDQIVTAVSCGLCTDPMVVLGFKPMPDNAPQATDAEGISALAAAAKAHGVRRLIAVTSASAGSV
jgi:nucleoside-diphosphate-sugar epimerase